MGNLEGTEGGEHQREAASARIHALAESDQPVLIEGESGAGKEELARYIHAHSPRREQLFVVLRCRGVPESLFEAELFGAARGSFTGRVTYLSGFFETCKRGTLFFDEVGALALMMQAKLLRVFMEGAYRMVGENKARPVECRLLFATAEDLDKKVEQREFRADTRAHLGRHAMRLDSVRARPEALPGLLDRYRRSLLSRELRGYFPDGSGPSFSPEAIEAAARAEWPGNVRALEEAALWALGLSEPGQAVGPEALCPRGERDGQRRLRYVLERALSRKPEVAEAEAFLGETERWVGQVVRWRDNVWNSSGPRRSRNPPSMPLPGEALVPALSCLLRLDRLADKPRWPRALEQGLMHALCPRETPGLVLVGQ